MAANYAEACRYANERLERCGQLLSAGYRPEALAASEADPDLLQLVAVLTIPELDAWHELIGMYGWQCPEALKTPIANAINDAYAAQKRLAPLLTQHRGLAMQDAPLQQRLGVLRQLAADDPTTAFWREDVASFEQHYADEISAVAQGNLKANNLAAIYDFVNRFENEPWANPLPEKVANTFRFAVDRISYQQLFPKLANDLEQAYSRSDVGAGAKFKKTVGSVSVTLAIGSIDFGNAAENLQSCSADFR